jgi:transcriptional regulator with XRE-family HTH domain
MDEKLCIALKDLRFSRLNDKGKPISQAEFGKILGVSQQNIAEIEKCKREPSRNILKKVYEIFNVNLIGETNKSSPDIEFLLKQNEDLHKENTRLLLEINRLKSEIDQLKRSQGNQ